MTMKQLKVKLAHRFIDDNETSAGRMNNASNVIKSVSHCMLRNRICQTDQFGICFKRRQSIKEKNVVSINTCLLYLHTKCHSSNTGQTNN